MNPTTEQTANTPTETTTPPPLPQKKRPKLQRKTILIITLALIAVLAIPVFNRITSPIHLTKIQTTNALSSRIRDAETKTSFTIQEPIMLHLQYTKAPAGKSIKFTVKNDQNQTVREGTTTPLRLTESDPTEGQRHISLVNTETDPLPTGKYTADLIFNNRTIHTHSFEIK